MNKCETLNLTIQRLCNSTGLLPPEYQQVEWIGAREYDYIDTGIIIPSNYERLEIKINSLSNSSNWRYFGTWSGNCSILGYHNAGPGPLDQLWVGNNEFTAAATQTNTVYSIDLTADNGYLTGVYCGETIDRTYTGTVSTGVSECIFYQRGKGCYANVYYYRLHTSAGLVRDMVPCYRKSDSKTGMYDLVSNTFFTDAGKWNMNFEKGADV